MNTPIAVRIECAKGEILNAMEAIQTKHALPPCIMDGVLSSVLAEVRSEAICSKQRNDKKDTQEETERRAENDTMVVVKLENIADDIKDIKRESRENREEMKQLRERVVIVEQSLKSYHKRLDGEQHSDR